VPWRPAMTDRLRDVREVMRQEMLVRDEILASLEGGPMTIPQIADAVGHPVHEVMYWVMAARKYGLVAESEEPDDDDYYQYGLVEKK